eukprot:5473648-Pyramimonas_sp.AAC.1
MAESHQTELVTLSIHSPTACQTMPHLQDSLGNRIGNNSCGIPVNGDAKFECNLGQKELKIEDRGGCL